MLRVTTKRTGATATATLNGPLDEGCDAPLSAALPKLAKLDVTLDCGEIDRVNSVGFRHWLRFLKALDAVATFNLERCAGPFLEYTAMLARTAYANRIVSVLVPYRCDGCGRIEQTTYEVDEAGSVAPDAFPESICSKCNGIMRSEVEPVDHLAFLRAT